MDHAIYIDIIGSVAAACTTASFIPQVLKVHRTKHTKDLSLPMYVIFELGVFAWIYFGYLVHSRPVVLANIIIGVLCFYVIVMKLKHG